MEKQVSTLSKLNIGGPEDLQSQDVGNENLERSPSPSDSLANEVSKPLDPLLPRDSGIEMVQVPVPQGKPDRQFEVLRERSRIPINVSIQRSIFQGSRSDELPVPTHSSGARDAHPNQLRHARESTKLHLLHPCNPGGPAIPDSN